MDEWRRQQGGNTPSFLNEEDMGGGSKRIYHTVGIPDVCQSTANFHNEEGEEWRAEKKKC